MDKYSVREATVADAKGIALVHVDSWKETYSGIIPQDFLDSLSYDKRAEGWTEIIKADRPFEKIFVLENKDQKIVGFAVAGKSREQTFHYDGELHAIYLLKSHQGLGLGRTLFDKCMEANRSFGFQSMFVWVLRENPTTNFYIHLGAEEFNKKLIEIGGKQLEEVAFGWKTI
jgi:L-amino acid N-acyltransferase YncA